MSSGRITIKPKPCWRVEERVKQSVANADRGTLIVVPRSEYDRMAPGSVATIFRRRPVHPGSRRIVRPSPAIAGEHAEVTVLASTVVDLARADDERAGELGFGSAGEMRRWWRERFAGERAPASEAPLDETFAVLRVRVDRIRGVAH